MTRTQKWIVAFWVFIGVMCLWSLYDYNNKLNKQAEEHPEQTKFIFLPTKVAPAAPASPAHADKADVEQVGYRVEPDTPSPGSFTAYVTLKNLGTVPATQIQICVRPYRGASNFDEDVGHSNPNGLSDDDPLSKLSDWLSFPDLAPGESSTRPTIFTTVPNIKPGSNPKPQIVFVSDKKGPMKPRPPEPTSTTPGTTPAPDATPGKHHAADG